VLGGKRVEAREYASQGQARTLALALKLSLLSYLSSNREDPPVILLDDVEAELDDRRKAALYERVKALSCQTIITGTEQRGTFKSSFPGADVLHVSRGIVTRSSP
jgi:DNA replication and repair protein RecF